MGNSNSSNNNVRTLLASAPSPPPPPAPAPPTPQEKCATAQTNLNNAKNDIETCDPEASTNRHKQEYMKDIDDFVSQKRQEMNKANAEFNEQVRLADNMMVLTKPIRTIITELQNEEKKYMEESRQLDHAARAHRRRFLDSNPQEGVLGFMGIRTNDDKVLIAFWITFLTALISVTLMFLYIYLPAANTKQKVQTTAIVTISGLVLAYYIISSYA